MKELQWKKGTELNTIDKHFSDKLFVAFSLAVMRVWEMFCGRRRFSGAINLFFQFLLQIAAIQQRRMRKQRSTQH